MIGRGSHTWWARAGRSSENVDRILVGLCALIWLVLLGMSAAAAVALVDLGRGFHKPMQNPHTGLLYIVIGVSALIILAAVPVLLRARRTSPLGSIGSARPATRPAGFPPPEPRGGAAPVRSPERTPYPGSADPTTGGSGTAARPIRLNDTAAERVWLRGTTELVSVIGAALIAVATATYLMAISDDGAAWASYGVAGLVTAATPVIPWRYLRQLRQLPAASRPRH